MSSCKDSPSTTGKLTGNMDKLKGSFGEMNGDSLELVNGFLKEFEQSRRRNYRKLRRNRY
jgi:hypothetical protein